jgi:molecular chaperone HtpG
MVRALGAAKKEERVQDVDDLANLLLDQACILDGEIPSDPAAFARRLNGYVVRALGAKT